MEKQLICISRQYGSGGREIGEAVAKKLGLPCYDKCLITQAAQKSGLPEGIVAEYDERGEDLGFAISGNPFADSAALAETFYSGQARVFDAERRVILDLAAQGGCVIIGRCASAILRGAGNIRSPFLSMPILPTAPDALPPGTGWTNGAPCTGRRKSTGCASITSIFTRTPSGVNRPAMI